MADRNYSIFMMFAIGLALALSAAAYVNSMQAPEMMESCPMMQGEGMGMMGGMDHDSMHEMMESKMGAHIESDHQGEMHRRMVSN